MEYFWYVIAALGAGIGTGLAGLSAATVMVPILMWGTGDAAAALVGIPFGRHKIKTRWTDGKKSREGTAAMFAVSFVSGLLMLLLAHEAGLPHALLSAAAGALFGALTELFSPSEYDTVTVPAVIAAVLLLINAAVH